MFTINMSIGLMSFFAMQALRSIREEMRYATPLVFNYSFAVNNYRSMLLRNFEYKKKVPTDAICSYKMFF
jgi:hypothetical protein